ncbi:MAG: acetyl-CoA carboxylase biotin carboxylase subunit [Acidobacteriota bacterium]|nr:acetyl-CoA carboxylase biotin carboxylase subunit [Acidobacteriota bacterium]
MFRKVLVANRGEIALRIISACKELRVQTVAVYSEADRDSLHVRFADEAVCIGPARSDESYLNIASILSAAEITNADAIHPGYGYLAENADFAEICNTCNIKFIGPPAEIIELMGNKAQARKKMIQSGLPVIPGTGIVTNGDVDVQNLSEKVGFPLIIKAAAGGGGRGMRVIHNLDELPDALTTAQSEAQNAFGNSDVYIERFLENTRHIEFQILADEHGNVVHLGERDCSIQRRHQKLIEESPSPIMSAKLRQELGQQVVQAMKDINYQNVGTIEFLFEPDGNYYFIEMNTRVQVEHPVTEMVTGLDIVKEQMRSAAGEKFIYSQEDIDFRGHSVECRINAECPETFVPSPGKVTAYHPPGGPGIRVDSTVHTSCSVPPYYDSLIAKVIAHGVDRQEALDRLNRALDVFVIEGIKTSIPLHKKIINHPDFVKGQFDTAFLEKLKAQN